MAERGSSLRVNALTFQGRPEEPKRKRWPKKPVAPVIRTDFNLVIAPVYYAERIHRGQVKAYGIKRQKKRFLLAQTEQILL